jgi:hypothetical protein
LNNFYYTFIIHTKILFMKKLFIFASLLFTCHSKIFAQVLGITNTSDCDVDVNLYAHEAGSMLCPHSTCFDLNSNTITLVASTGSVSYSKLADVNLAVCAVSGSGPGWQYMGSGYCTCSSSGVWDEATITVSGAATILHLALSSCPSGYSSSDSGSDCTAGMHIYADWDGVGKISIHN